jgi:hypothetical protein
MKSKLNENGEYQDPEPCPAAKRRPETPEAHVFISKPGCLDHCQQQLVASLRAKLDKERMIPEMLDRADYPQFGAMAEVQRSMSRCSGVVLFAFRQLEIRDGVWRLDTADEKHITDLFWSTPWIQIEAGMAAMHGLPILVLCQRGIDGGIFDLASNDPLLYRAFMDDDWEETAFSDQFAGWCAAVRDRLRSM